MTTQELRELDAWIDRNLFNRSEELSKIADHYTTSQHYAMDVLKKCSDECDDIVIRRDREWDNKWIVGYVQWDAEAIWAQCKAETLELAICLFAKKLFSQTTK